MVDANYFPPAPKKTEIEKTVTTGVTKAVVNAANDPEIAGVQPEAAPAIIDAVLNKILPVILHSTSQEPWYKSRVFWSASLSIAGAAAGLVGYKFDTTAQAEWLALIMIGSQAIAAILALWGRYAKTPLGK